MDYWVKPGLDRQQAMLFYPTLDQSISNDHPVRLLDEILRAQKWSAWEQEYDGRRGQPPIPPWIMAGVILHGLMRRIRSSRQLEYACAHNIDFLWRTEGRTIDHATLCLCRTKFKEPLQQLFKQVGRLATTDGTQNFIVDCDVIAGPNEHPELLPSVDRVVEDFGQKPARRPRHKRDATS